MYKIAVPITNRYPNREMNEAATLAELKKAGGAARLAVRLPRHRIRRCAGRRPQAAQAAPPVF